MHKSCCINIAHITDHSWNDWNSPENWKLNFAMLLWSFRLGKGKKSFNFNFFLSFWIVKKSSPLHLPRFNIYSLWQRVGWVTKEICDEYRKYNSSMKRAKIVNPFLKLETISYPSLTPFFPSLCRLQKTIM